MDEKTPEQPNRLSKEDLERALNEYDKKLTPDYLRKRLKLAIYKKVEAGDMAALDDIAKLEKLDKVTPDASPASATPPGSPDSATGEPGIPSEEEEEDGLPQRFRVKRKYTWSDAAQAARIKNSQARRPGSEGNKRNWRGGLFAQDFIHGRIKPCLSTCPIFDECELIEKGVTRPGRECLDKQSVIETYSALMEAIKGTGPDRYDDFNSVSALTIAETMHVYRKMLEDIMREGAYIKREKYDKNGVLQSVEYVPHPNMMAAPKLFADLGLNPNTMMATPKAIKDDKNKEEETETFGRILGKVGKMIQVSEDKKAEGKE